MTDLADIRAGIAAAITHAITDVQCNGYVVANPVPPFFDVELATEAVEYDQAMARGLDKWVLTVRGVVAVNDSLSSQKNLDAWCASSGTSSVKAALESDLTLGGKVEALQVTKLSGYGPVYVKLHPNTVYLGAEWTVELYARG